MFPILKTLVLFALLFFTATHALPAPESTPFNSNLTIPYLTVQNLVAAAPGICTNQTAECTPAATAIIPINCNFSTQGITTLGQKAALLGLMSLESVDFTYNVNKVPGRPGQGTKAMLMFPFVYEFAFSQPELQSIVLALNDGKNLSVTLDTIDSVPPMTQSVIRGLVLGDKYTFAAAGWFVKSKCDAGILEGLSSGGFAGFKEYISKCVKAGEVTKDRLGKWCAAVKALKPAEMKAPGECA